MTAKECLTYSTRRVLIADDEPVVADTIKRMLQAQLGCVVHALYSGEEAVDRLRTASYDVLLTDMLMPGLHGLELIQKVQETAPGCAIVVMTAHPEEFPYVRVINAGAADFLVKPYQAVELEAKIVRIFREQDLRAELAQDKERILRDMGEMEDVRSAQVLAETKYRSLFDLGMNGMVLAQPGSYRVIDVNQAMCELSGRTKDDILSLSLFDLIDPYERGRFQQGLTLLSEGGRGTLSDMILVRPDGRQIFLDVSVTFMTVRGESFVLLALKDVTEQRELQQQLTDIAQRDSLTGLYNKRTFHVRLESAISRARRLGDSVTLMLIDLDNFKLCNDQHGHQTGDGLLSRVGALISEQVRGATDEGFRYGGDEFAVLIGDLEPILAARVGERLRAKFSAGECYGTTMSIGLATYQPGLDVDAFIRLADQALYTAKSLGKNVVHVA